MKEREGDLPAAIALYLKGGVPARAAQVWPWQAVCSCLVTGNELTLNRRWVSPVLKAWVPKWYRTFVPAAKVGLSCYKWRQCTSSLASCSSAPDPN